MSAEPEPEHRARPGALDELDARMLAFERRWVDRPGSKDAAIRAEFGVSPARYYQMLYVLLDDPVALRHDPMLVRRLQRLRDARRAARSERTFRLDPEDPH